MTCQSPTNYNLPRHPKDYENDENELEAKPWLRLNLKSEESSIGPTGDEES
jgi:hypothetical protein